ncbi:MAG: VWA domain-containing protein [Acidobacteriota bacterium]|nr:VWA domain-containing protein [Acidobacteriota bacterium]
MSKRFFTLLILAAAPLLAAAPPLLAQQPQQSSQTFGEKVDVNLVQLDAVVTDARGNQMLGLGKDDFVVRENGAPQTIDSVDYFTNRRLLNANEANAAFKVERVHEERYLVIFFDKAQAGEGQSELIRARSDVARFIDDRLRPEDRVAVVGHDVRLKVYSDFTSDKAQLRRALNDATSYGLGLRSKDAASSGASLLRNMDFDRMINKTGAVFEALDLLGDTLRPIHARKDLVLFSNGIIAPDEEVRGGLVMSRSRYYDPMIESLNSADVTVYPISLQGVTIDVPEFVHQNLTSLANDTNGQYYRLHTSYTSPLRQIEKQTAGYYLISYYTKKRPGEHGFQKVDVVLRNPEFKVSARSGYSYGE